MKKTRLIGNIYTDNLPAFEEYTIINNQEEVLGSLNRITNNKGILPIEALYIKGTNRIDNNNCIGANKFFYDYLELGKQLFELSLLNNKMSFKIHNSFDNNLELNNYYLERIIRENDFDIPGLYEEEKELLDEIQRCIGSFEKLKKRFSHRATEIDRLINMSREIETTLLILTSKSISKNEFVKLFNLSKEAKRKISSNSEFHCPIFKELYTLLDILNSTIGLLSETSEKKSLYISIFEEEKENIFSVPKILDMCRNDLEDLLKVVEDKKFELKFDLKKEISLSKIKKLDDISNINIINKFEEPILTITYSYNQLEDLKKVLIPWLKKYGFPYYNPTISLNDNEELIPCNILITNSIFNYMYYSLYVEWQTTDKRILDIFGFDTTKSFRENRSSIINIKNDLDYYNNQVTSKIQDFDCSCYEKDSFKGSDNYFNYLTEDGDLKETIFNNLCIAMNKIVKEKTTKFIANHKLENCSICGKAFEPGKYRKVCSDECSRKREALKKQKQRQQKKKN